MKTRNELTVIRRIKKEDDAAAIARCLFLTDPYIYPQICPDAEDDRWIRYVGLSLEKKDAVFAKDNFFVAVRGGKIVGACCFLEGGRRYDCLCRGADLCESEGFLKVREGYFDPLIEENFAFTGHDITNLCVLPEYRGKRIGLKLMKKLILRYGKEPLHLDVLEENSAAVALYEKCGFEVVRRYAGFGVDGDVPCLHMIRRPDAL